jgi:hypothetical protein
LDELNKTLETVKAINSYAIDDYDAECNKLYESLNGAILNSFDKAFTPLKKDKIRRKYVKDEPWWTKELTLLNIRIKPFSRPLKASNMNAYKISLTLTRSNFKKLKALMIAEAKQKHVLKLIEKFKNNPNCFWKVIGLESRSSVNMEIDEQTLTNHFADIYNNMLQTDESKILEKMQESIVNDYAEKIHGTIGQENITPEYMKDILKSLK